MTTQFVTFTLDDKLCGIPVERIVEVLPGRDRTPVPLSPPDVAGLVNLRGQVVLSIDLRERLGIPPFVGVDGAEQMMVVVLVGGENVALLVDKIGDVVEVEAEQFETPPQTLPENLRAVISGAYKLPGRLLLALDVDEATLTGEKAA